MSYRNGGVADVTGSYAACKKKGDWLVTKELDWVEDVPAAAVIIIPVEGGRELSARAIYFEKAKNYNLEKVEPN